VCVCGAGGGEASGILTDFAKLATSTQQECILLDQPY